ncbi:MAG TPA: type II secretion system major pseudopilin GspG [Azospirillaceae bacterium]|nr:type II secretion system major pseudopilin GspG [Azospirillaceae bacterium]
MSKPERRRRPRASQAGFTLLELLVVLVILGLLAAFAAPQVTRHLARAKTDSAGLQVQNLVTTLDLYRLDVGRYPSEAEGLLALFEAPADAGRWNGPYLRKREMLADPWGRAYGYRYPGEHGEFDLFTLGADNAVGGTGEAADVVSW